MRRLAEALFHAPPRDLNCAQSVLAAWQETTGECLAEVESFRILGGGRAPGGTCGALHAACLIRPQAAESLRAAFQDQVGHLDCESIKPGGEPVCRGCVGIAAGLLDKYK